MVFDSASLIAKGRTRFSARRAKYFQAKLFSSEAGAASRGEMRQNKI